MFYNKLQTLCKEKGEKPSPLLKKLGLSTGNITKWSRGASVNSDILMKLSAYFDVPIDYLLTDTMSWVDTADNTASFKKAISLYTSNPSFFSDADLCSSLNRGELEIVADYMGCTVEILKRSGIVINDTNTSYKACDALTLILKILNTFAESEEYYKLQKTVSQAIVHNLFKCNINEEDLSAAGFSLPNEKPYNITNLLTISGHFHFSLEAMLTGKS